MVKRQNKSAVNEKSANKPNDKVAKRLQEC